MLDKIWSRSFESPELLSLRAAVLVTLLMSLRIDSLVLSLLRCLKSQRQRICQNLSHICGAVVVSHG